VDPNRSVRSEATKDLLLQHDARAAAKTNQVRGNFGGKTSVQTVVGDLGSYAEANQRRGKHSVHRSPLVSAAARIEYGSPQIPQQCKRVMISA